MAFHLLPRNKKEWRQIALFPFQAYVVIAYFVERHFWYSLPGNGGYRGSLLSFKMDVFLGYDVCIAVLLYVGVTQWFTHNRRKALVNFGLAIFGFWCVGHMGNFAVT